jgi:hypothetical protein
MERTPPVPSNRAMVARGQKGRPDCPSKNGSRTGNPKESWAKSQFARHRLEGELASNLPPPRQTLGVNQPKVALRQIVLDGEEIGVIEHVVKLEPNLEI